MRLSEKLHSAVLRDKQMIGLDLSWQAEATPIMRVILLSLVKGAVLIKDKWEVSDFNEFSRKIENNVPIALVLNGKNILHKESRLDKIEENSKLQRLSSLMPTLNLAEFYVQYYQAEETGFFSLIRSEKMNQICEQIGNLGYTITSLSLGPFAFKGILPFVLGEGETKEAEVIVGNQKIAILDGNIKAFKNLNPEESHLANITLKLGEDDIESKYLLAYAAAFRVLTNRPDNISLKVDLVENNRLEHIEKKKFKVGFASSLGFFFLLLLVNFLVFGKLSEQTSLLSRKLAAKQDNLKQLGKLGHEASAKKEFLEVTGWLDTPRTSFYADRLVSALPVGIRLTELAVNPLERKSSYNEGKLTFESGVIVVQGFCRNPIQLNNWIKSLGRYKWIRQVERQNYAFDEANAEGKFMFYVQLNEK